MGNDQAFVEDLSCIEKGTTKAFVSKFVNIEEMIEKHVNENDIDLEELLYEKDSFHEIWVEKSYINIPRLKVKIHQFIYCIKEEESEEFEADYSGWMFFDSKSNEYIYDEGYSCLYAAIMNRFSEEINNFNIDDLECEVFF